jgi:hypothetical protein
MGYWVTKRWSLTVCHVSRLIDVSTGIYPLAGWFFEGAAAPSGCEEAKVSICACGERSDCEEGLGQHDWRLVSECGGGLKNWRSVGDVRGEEKCVYPTSVQQLTCSCRNLYTRSSNEPSSLHSLFSRIAVVLAEESRQHSAAKQTPWSFPLVYPQPRHWESEETHMVNQ